MGKAALTKIFDPAHPKQPAVAILDAGGRSFSFRIYKYCPEKGGFKKIEKFKDEPNLGDPENHTKKGKLKERTREHMLDVLRGFADKRDQYSQEYDLDVIAIGTEPFRVLRNSGKLINKIKKETGFALTIITGDEEADYAADGILDSYGAVSAIVADMGGGSTEFVLLDQGEKVAKISLPLGTNVIRRQENPQAFIQEQLELLPDEFKNAGVPLYWTGGTPRAIMKAFSNVNGLNIKDKTPASHAIEHVQNFALGIAYARSVMGLEDDEQLAGIIGIEPERYKLLDSARWLLDAMHEQVGIEDVIPTKSSLRTGMLANYIVTKDFREKVEIYEQFLAKQQAAQKTPNLPAPALTAAAA